MGQAVVVGAGVGGLSAAIILAARGVPVRVIEMAERPGGKIGIAEHDGVELDTGPSLLTLPDALDRVFREGGSSLYDELELVRPDPAFRYRFPDGSILDLRPDVEASVESVREALGNDAGREFEAFLSYARRIWEAAAPAFVHGPAPSRRSLRRGGLPALLSILRIDPFRTMKRTIDRRVKTPELRAVFARFATYNGSDPRQAPATLNCIAHVELGLGGYGVRGGMYEIVRALVRTAERQGVEMDTGVRVARVRVHQGRVEGIEASDGQRLSASTVVFNADAGQVFGTLLPAGGRSPDPSPSTSGWVGVLRSRRRAGGERRAAHTVLFPENYMEEFADLFDRDHAPRDPSVYLCAQEVAHERTGWEEDEPVFVMANVPPEPADGARPDTVWEELRERVLGRVRSAGLCEPGDQVVFERTAAGLAREFPGSRGSLYGLASNSRTAAFRRPPNRLSSPAGAYLASGSAHPGGGIPLCALSGVAAAEAVLEDLHLPLAAGAVRR